MGLIVFDTETTGFVPGSICQLSYILQEGGRVCGRNYYFKVKYIEPGAQRVHRLTVDKLHQLSGNMEFSEHLEAIHRDFDSVDRWVAHNFDFDAKFLSSEFQRCRQSFPGSRGFCTMKHFTPICRLPGRKSMFKYPNLEELVHFFHIGEKEIQNRTEELFGAGSGSYHDARYDATATYLCYLKGVEKSYLPPLED
jgi:DNA polymerase III subunit epsilon